MDVQSISPSTPAGKSWNAFVLRWQLNVAFNLSGELTPAIDMWLGGPLRHVSVSEMPNCLLNADGLYCGPYVCRRCRHVTHGVYSPDWLCGDCLTFRNAPPRPEKVDSSHDRGQGGLREG